ncbi:UDP-glycosyltransferase UGT5-like [Daktulosphaira vitifoliae]|uniref:UDP-glycosyltransferase UGT5-like n=1 Tax=Daktulosphaira vitifoliae TaxID=58002 RepID=UPI0021A9CCB5|nr:UDP-glycosyltransferase UGT5-like [Daktulosphaira vitifoliae]
MTLIILFSTLFITIILCVSSARILGVFPHFGKSHHQVYLPYMHELANCGHYILIISYFESSHPNITDISLNSIKPTFENSKEIPDISSFRLRDWLSEILLLYRLAQDTENLFEVQGVKELVNNNSQKFDLVITEHFNSEFALGFAVKYNAPFILLSSCALLPWTASAVGQPHEVLYRPATASGLSQNMNLYEKFQNILYTFGWNLVFRLFHRPWSQRIIREKLNLQLNINDFVLKASLVLVNSHFSMNGPYPLVPQIVEVGGLHIKQPDRLPQDIQKFLDESEHGVIYFCMGSILRGETFPEKKRQMFLNVFNKLPQRVLWKYEGENLPWKSLNIMTKKWMPQREILAHPNVKLFISHGGMLSTTEAVYEGVPIIAMPIFADQMTNIKGVMTSGAAELLNYNNLEENEILTKIVAMINNPIYKQKAKELAERFHDRPLTPLKTAVYWTEYVIQHKSDHHIKSSAVEMSWYQNYMIDVILVALIFLTVICFTFFYFSLKILHFFQLMLKLKKYNV